MIDMRTVPDGETGLLQEPIKRVVETIKTWIKPVGIGRFGISFNVGSKEIFIGVSVAKILTETVVRRKDKRVLVRTSDVKIIDI
jgi:hypothetical protein